MQTLTTFSGPQPGQTEPAVVFGHQKIKRPLDWPGKRHQMTWWNLTLEKLLNKKLKSVVEEHTADKKGTFPHGLAYPYPQESITPIISIDYILKASSEIIGHSLGRTIWLSKQGKWSEARGRAESTGVQNGFRAPRLLLMRSPRPVVRLFSKCALAQLCTSSSSWNTDTLGEGKSSGTASNQQMVDFLRIKVLASLKEWRAGVQGRRSAKAKWYINSGATLDQATPVMTSEKSRWTAENKTKKWKWKPILFLITSVHECDRSVSYYVHQNTHWCL